MRKESLIQSKIIKLLEKSGWIVIRLRATSGSGWPDLLALKKGRTIFIEVKDPKGNLSPMQEEKIKILTEEKFTVLTISDPEHIKFLL